MHETLMHEYVEGCMIIHRKGRAARHALGRCLDSVRGALRQYSPVPPEPGVAATPSRIPIDLRRLPWVKPLVVDYASHYERLSEFYAGDPRDPQAWRDAIARSQRHPRPRQAVTEILEAQQRRRGAAPEALAATDRLRRPDTVAVVTGQQAGLFGGPLFTLLKAMTAIQLARQVEAQHGVPAVAVFWIDAEDHDWDEVKSCRVLDAELTPRILDVGSPQGAGSEPVARLCLDDGIERVIADLASALPHTEFSAPLVDTIRAAYRSGISMADAFGRWLDSLLGPRGLIVFDAADPRAKPLVVDLFVAEIQRPGETAQLATKAGEALQRQGYSAQVVTQPGTSALFDLRRGRKPIRVQDASLPQFEDGGGVTSQEALVARVRSAPSEFGPNVLLRPVVQDALFPTVCYVAGPNELAYLGQLREVYGAFGVPMPLMYQRATATLLDAGAARFLSRHNLPLDSLRARDESALNRLLEAQLPADVERSLHDLSGMLDEQMGRVAASVARVDTTLEGAVRSWLGRVQDDLKKLHGKVVQAEKRKDETLRRQFRQAQAQAFPDGHPQEREIGFVYFLNKYGPALVDRLADELSPPEMGTHVVLIL